VILTRTFECPVIPAYVTEWADTIHREYRSTGSVEVKWQSNLFHPGMDAVVSINTRRSNGKRHQES
jgi:hypothetical protein